MKTNICPECKKENIYFSPKNVCYVCEECAATFVKPEQNIYCPTRAEIEAGFDNDKVAGSISHLPPVDTRVVKVFLASSTSADMKDKREVISAAVCMANSEDETLYIDLYHCEDDDRSKRGRTQQEEYNERIRDCDVFVLLSSNSELGSITLNEEVMLAVEQQRERGIKLFVFADKSERSDTERGANWRRFKNEYLPLFEPLFSYKNDEKLAEKAKSFIYAIRSDSSIGEVYRNCSRVGYNIDLIGSDISARKYLNAIADKLNTLNNRFIQKDPYQSLQFKVKIRCGDGLSKISPLNDNYFVIPCDKKDCSEGSKGVVFAKIEECFKSSKEKTDVSLFRGDNESGREYLPEHEKKLFDIMDNNYSFSFSHKDTVVNKPTMNERLSEIREAYSSLEEGLYYLHQKNYYEAERGLLIGAEFGFPTACFYLGYIYGKIDGFKDPEKAEKYTLLAADAGVVTAMHNISVIYLKKLQNESDPKSNKELIRKVEKYCKQAGENGVYQVYYNLGIMYTLLGRKNDAEKVYKISADKGDPRSQFNLAVLYQERGKDKEAIEYYSLSAGKGYAKAMVNLASMCADKGKFSNADSLLAAAANLGQLEAILSLSNINLQKGNLSEAEKYFKMVPDQNMQEVLLGLGNVYLQKGDLSKAEEYFRKVPDQNIPEVLLGLGHILSEKGELEAAEQYLLKAYSEFSDEHGEIKVAYETELGLLYERKNELDKAEKFYRLAAEGGDSTAQFNLGHLLWKYYGDKRLDEAEKYLIPAAESGDEDAAAELEFLRKEVELLPAAAQGDAEAMLSLGAINLYKVNYPEAEKYLLEAYAKLSDNNIAEKISCEVQLGALYLFINEPDKAKKYYKLAAEKGDENAKNVLAMMCR